MDEFGLIRRYFASQKVARRDVEIGIGDDAAVLRPPAQGKLIMTADLLISDVHFPAATAARNIGHKALAVNLSDLAAMGADPAWALLSLSVPHADPAWFEDFAAGLFGLAEMHAVELVGGDLVRGALSVGIQLTGFAQSPLLRSGARPEDDIYVTGELGGAGIALAALENKISLDANELALVLGRLERPEPQVAVGVAIAGLATSAIDISDGLTADLGHLLADSRVGARVELEAVPLCAVHRTHFSALGWEVALSVGDDYELCFTAPPDLRSRVADIAARTGVRISRIGVITRSDRLQFVHGGRSVPIGAQGYKHFE